MNSFRDRQSRLSLLGYVFGVLCFVVIIPFGMVFGVLHRRFARIGSRQDRVRIGRTIEAVGEVEVRGQIE